MSVNDFRASISSITSFTPLFNPEVRELDTLLRVFSAQVTLWITSPATLAAMEKGFGIPRLAIPLLFFNLVNYDSGDIITRDSRLTALCATRRLVRHSSLSLVDFDRIEGFTFLLL